MRRIPIFLTAALAACVSVEPLADPKGSIAAKQRLVVLVWQAPGPWIVKDSDSKAESAAKILPVGFLLQNVQNDKTLEFSKDLQQYLPRPRYDRQLADSLIKTLKTLHGGPVQTAEEAGISPAQLRDWNLAKDQLDWRLRYYAPEAGLPSPRDYSKILSLDDAAILEVNLSFGTEATDTEEVQILPTLSAVARVYRADTSHLLWNREEILSDKTSSMTISEFRLEPWQLTQRLEKLAPPLGETLARLTTKALGLTPPAATKHAAPPSAPAPAPGALPYGMTEADLARYSQFDSSSTLVSTTTVKTSSGAVSLGNLPVNLSTTTAAVEISSGTVAFGNIPVNLSTAVASPEPATPPAHSISTTTVQTSSRTIVSETPPTSAATSTKESPP